MEVTILRCDYCGLRDERPGVLDKDHREECERCPDGIMKVVGLYRVDKIDD